MNEFTLFLKCDSSVPEYVSEYWSKLSVIFKKLSKNIYSENIDLFHIAMRVDGKHFSFGDPEGCNSLRLMKSKRTIANSISFGESIYKNEKTLIIFLKSNILLAFEQMIKRLEKDKIYINNEQLMGDLKFELATL